MDLLEQNAPISDDQTLINGKAPLVQAELSKHSTNCFIESELFPYRVPSEALSLAASCCCCLLDFVGTDDEDRCRSGGTGGSTNGGIESSWIGLINCCTHTFHFDCVFQWGQRENKCPQCKLRYGVLAAYTREGKRILYRKIRNVSQKKTLQEEEESLKDCFICHISQGFETSIRCEGNSGNCTESCHLSCLDLPTNLDRFEWFCPTCIRQYRCINSNNQRASIYSRRLIRDFRLPTLTIAPIDTLANSPHHLKPFLSLYRHVSNPAASNLPSLRTQRVTDVAPRQITSRNHEEQASNNNNNKNDYNDDNNNDNNGNVYDDNNVNRNSSSSSSASQILERGNSVSSYRLRSRRRRAPAEINESAKIEQMVRTELDIDELYEETTTMRGLPSDFKEYEQYRRYTLGHDNYGKSRLASRQEDGGCLSGRDFISTMLSNQTPADVEWDTWEITRKKQRRKTTFRQNESVVENLVTDSNSNNIHTEENSIISCRSSYTDSASSERRLKPTRELVDRIKAGLAIAGIQRNEFKEICRATAESLSDTHKEKIKQLSSQQSETYWNKQRDTILIEIGKHIERYRNKVCSQ